MPSRSTHISMIISTERICLGYAPSDTLIPALETQR